MKTLSPLIAFFLFLSALNAQATIQITNVTGSSAWDNTTTTAPVIFGGTAGTDCSATAADIYSTCNSCASLSGSFAACNLTRIYDGLKLRISFKTDSIENGVAFIKNSDGNAISVTPAPISRSKGEVHVIEIPWSNACAGTDKVTGSSCENATFTGNLTLGVSSDTDTTEDPLSLSITVFDPDTNDSGDYDTILACTDSLVKEGGICDFQAYPGDEKIFINQLEQSSGFPGFGGITIKTLRFFVGSEEDPGGFVTDPNQGFFVDLEVGTDANGQPETTSRVIEGTNNGVLHFLRVATVDQANNVSRFTSNQAIIDYCKDINNPDDGCIFTAKPDEALGLLEDDLNCFITSVAYGSALDSRVEVFRDFRNQVLNQSIFGKRIIALYNTYGPHGAVWLQNKPWLKPMVRMLLWPTLGFAWASTHWGLEATALLTLLLISLVTLSLHHVWRQTRVQVSHEK